MKGIDIFEDKLREFSSAIDDFAMNYGCMLGIVFIIIIVVLIILIVR